MDWEGRGAMVTLPPLSRVRRAPAQPASVEAMAVLPLRQSAEQASMAALGVEGVRVTEARLRTPAPAAAEAEWVERPKPLGVPEGSPTSTAQAAAAAAAQSVPTAPGVRRQRIGAAQATAAAEEEARPPLLLMVEQAVQVAFPAEAEEAEEARPQVVLLYPARAATVPVASVAFARSSNG